MTTELDELVIRKKVDHVVATHEDIALPIDLLSTPGDILKEEIEERGWTQKDLADIMDRPVQAISEIVNGVKQITPQTAVELGAALDMSPETWMHLEADYRLAVARASKSEDAISRRARMYALAPVSELLRRGWLPARATVEADLCRFLGIASIWDEPEGHASLRVSVARGPEMGATAAWVRRVEILASYQAVAAYDPDLLAAELDSIASMSTNVASAADLPARLAALGVHFVVVPHLAKTYLDGASLWMGENPVVAVTIRYDRIDSFWFTVMHELAHIVLGHRDTIAEAIDADTQNPREIEANGLASKVLVDAEVYARVAAMAGRADGLPVVVEAAAAASRHPGILVGRLQHDGVLGFDRGRTHLVKVRQYLREVSDRVPA